MSAVFVLGLVEFAIAMVIFFVLGSMSWIASSEDDDCITERSPTGDNSCFCESFHPGMIKQPINTWSNLGFVLAGLLILSRLGSGDPATAPNPLMVVTLYSVLYGGIVIFLGPGSMFFHASMKQWAGWIDTFSMILYTGFLFVYDLTNILGAGDAVFVILYLIVVIGLGWVSWKVHRIGPLSGGAFSFGMMALLWALAQFPILIGNWGGIQREWTFFILAFISFASAMVIWSQSQTGGPLCKPDSWLQGHGIWHLLTALTTVFIYFYLVSQI